MPTRAALHLTWGAAEDAGCRVGTIFAVHAGSLDGSPTAVISSRGAPGPTALRALARAADHLVAVDAYSDAVTARLNGC